MATPDQWETVALQVWWRLKGGGGKILKSFVCLCCVCVCVCVYLLNCCVCVFSSHSFWTSSSLDVPAGVAQEASHTEFLIHLLSAVRALIFLARRIQPFLSLVNREVEFCVLTILIVLHPLGIFSFSFLFFGRKIPYAEIELTSQRVRRLHGYL